jgi:hypothetical protein
MSCKCLVHSLDVSSNTGLAFRIWQKYVGSLSLLQLVKNTDVVVGDVMQVDTGDKLIADGVLIDHHHLVIDEASLTGVWRWFAAAAEVRRL